MYKHRRVIIGIIVGILAASFVLVCIFESMI